MNIIKCVKCIIVGPVVRNSGWKNFEYLGLLSPVIRGIVILNENYITFTFLSFLVLIIQLFVIQKVITAML